MKIRNVVLILGLCIFSGCSTTTFTLRSLDGKKVCGPYTFAQGQLLYIDSELLVLHKELPPNQDLKKRMKNKVVPELFFRDAHVREVVWLLNSIYPDYYSPEMEWANPHIKIILVIPEDKEKTIPLITLEAKTISLYSAAQTVAKLTGLNFTIHDGQAWLEYVE